MRAFTLIEILLSFTLLSLVFILVLNLFPTSLASVHRSEQRYQAVLIAGSLIEREAAKSFRSLTVPTNKDLDDQEYDHVKYHPHLDVVAVPGEDQAWLKSVRITVSWKYKDQDLQLIRELRVHRLASQ